MDILICSNKAGKISLGLRAQEKALLGLCICLYLYTQKTHFKIYLSPKSFCNYTVCFKEGFSWSIVITQLKSVLKLHFNRWHILEETTKPKGTFCQRIPDTLETGTRYRNQLRLRVHPCKF